jgi:hypothetical protein
LKEIQKARTLDKDASSISHILDELESRIKDNIVCKDLLNLRVENSVKYDRSSLDDIEKKIRVLSSQLRVRPYALKCFDLIERYCVGNEKGKIEFLSKELISALCNYGVSATHINNSVVKHFFKGGKINGTSVLKDFFQDIFPHHHSFAVCFIITTPAKDVSSDILKIFKLEMTQTIPAEFLEKPGSKIRNLKNNESYLIVKNISAPDKFSAVDAAKHSIQRMHDLHNIFHHKQTYSIDDTAHILQTCCDDEISDAKVIVNQMQFITDNAPEGAAQKLERMIGSINLPGGADREKFFRIVSFHGANIRHSSIETQVVNIWTALETMTPSKPNASIISSVVSGSVPFITLNYATRIIKQITFDLIRWNRHSLARTLKKCNLPENGDLLDKIFSLITLEENNDALKEILSDLGNFELLKYRIYLINKSLMDSESVINFLEKHEERVKWQIHRIYRARNSIVHTGETPTNASNLLSNAHDYFDQAFEISSTFCSGENGFDNYQDAFNFAKWACDQYISDIKNLGKFDTSSSRKILWRPPVPQLTA